MQKNVDSIKKYTIFCLYRLELSRDKKSGSLVRTALLYKVLGCQRLYMRIPAKQAVIMEAIAPPNIALTPSLANSD